MLRALLDSEVHDLGIELFQRVHDCVDRVNLVRGDLSTTWIYIAGPIVGAMCAIALEWILKGKPTAASTSAAQGT